MSKHIMAGYQLYAVRGEVERDMDGTLHALADMGWQGVEFAGFFGHTAKEIAKLLKKTELKAAGSHVPFEQIEGDMHGVIQYHLDIGCENIVIPYLSEERRPGGACFADTLRLMSVFGRLCRKSGIALSYHNHGFEFMGISGVCGLEFMLGAVPDTLLKAEPDTCWLHCAGVEPAAFLRAYARRCPLVHLRDFAGTYVNSEPRFIGGLPAAPAYADDAPFTEKPLGMGREDLTAIIAAAKETHVKWLIAEQDESPERAPLDDARMSARYLLEQL